MNYFKEQRRIRCLHCPEAFSTADAYLAHRLPDALRGYRCGDPRDLPALSFDVALDAWARQ
jgi:hypothetical protein